MATSIRSSSINNASTGTAITVSAPSGTTTGDLAICVVVVNWLSPSTLSDNNGSTPFSQDLAMSDYAGSGGGGVAVYSRRIQAGDPSTYAFTQGGSARWTAIAFTIQNPDPTTKYDVTPVAGNINSATSGTTMTANSITTSTNGSLNIILGMVDNATTTITAVPSGYTTIQNGGSQPAAAVYKVISTSGATGSQTFTNSLSGNWGTLQFAVKNYNPTATSGSMMLNMDAG